MLLPDLLAPGLDVVLVSTSGGACAGDRGHHHAGPGDDFWRLLHVSGLVPEPLAAADEERLLGLGIGLLDLVPDADGPTAAARSVADRVAAHAPGVVALHGKGTAAAYARGAGLRPAPLGWAPWTIADRPVFVLPSASGANRRRDYDGRPDRESWWTELAATVRGTRVAS